jgi:Zn finger protein HypA/HybF involved in hydrogenase expression
VQRHAKTHRAKRVIAVAVLAGILSGIEKDSFEFYWQRLTKNTLMEKSIISLEYVKDDILLLVKSIELEN